MFDVNRIRFLAMTPPAVHGRKVEEISCTVHFSQDGHGESNLLVNHKLEEARA